MSNWGGSLQPNLFSRHDLLSRYEISREVDVKGHLHPNELRRKLARDVTRYGLLVIRDDGGVQRDAVGQATGIAWGVIDAGVSQVVSPGLHVSYLDEKAYRTAAGLLGVAPILFGLLLAIATAAALILVVLGIVAIVLLTVYKEQLFRRSFYANARIDAAVRIQLQGEVYEDFRAGTNVPMSSNLAILLGGSVKRIQMTTNDQDLIMARETSKLELYAGVDKEYGFWNTKVKDFIETTADKAAATIKELEASFAGEGDVTFSGPVTFAPLRPIDAPGNAMVDSHPSSEGAEGRAIPPGLRYKVLERDKFTCRYCGRKAPEVVLEIDHSVAWAAGGETNIDNLVTACRDCNRGKSSVSVDPNTTKSSIFDDL
jgi:hypothetical protein